ncbi:MAG: LysM peptidoglycan-binding domain-containing protein [Candidatus Thiodiazotropha sp.]|jgi:membrane-bound lytic murein transglycosylase D
MNFIFICLLTACQSLPGTGQESSLTKVTSDPQTTEILQTKPLPGAKQLQQEEMPKIAEQLQQVIESQPTPAPSNLWQRMVRNYGLSAPDNPRLLRELNWYTNHPKYLERIQERAAPFLHFIIEEIEKRGMPAEIALLPAIESAFQPFAYSPGRAAGMWQFIPSTGREFGLKQNWWYDGRRDAVFSTRAALDYLQALSKQFDGDWELALAAYNSGAGTVRRAISRNKKHNKATDFWSLNLPDETSAYVPRLLALAKVIKDSLAHAIETPVIPDEPYFTTINIGSQLDLALAADMADIPIQELYILNAGFNRWATPPDGPHQLTLPLNKVETFREKLATLPSEKRLSWKRYKIKAGDTLSSIARHHGTTSKFISDVNKLSSNKIRAGRHLLIPVSSKKLGQYVYTQKLRKAAIQNRPRKGQKQYYRVKPGDSLWKIAKSHKISYKKLAAWNGMAPGDPLKAGQKLVIWVSKKSSSKVSMLDHLPTNTQSRLHYKVRRGDSLSLIAQRFKVSITDLKRWNTLSGKYLKPGQRLNLYVDVTEQTL